MESEDSMLSLCRRLLTYRRGSDHLRLGSYRTHPASNDGVYVFGRSTDSGRVIVAINFTDTVQVVDVGSGQVVSSTTTGAEPTAGPEGLVPSTKEAVIVEAGDT